MANREYERRRHRRYSVRQVNGQLPTAERPQIKPLEISLTGLRFETYQQLRVDSDQRIRLQGHGQPISLNVEVRWCQLVRTESGPHGDTVPVYRAGADFRAALSRQAEALLRFIARHAEIELEPPIDIRLDLPAGESRIAAGTATLHRVSVTHLEIETALDLQLGDQLEVVAESDRLYLTASATVAALGPDRGPTGHQTELDLLEAQHQATAALEQLVRSAVE